MAIGMVIRKRRKQLGLTLADVAARVGCRKGYLSMIETGQRPPPSRAILTELEQVLMFDPDELTKTVQWAATPKEVKQEVDRLARRDRQATALAEQLLHSSNLDKLFQSGELQRFVDGRSSNVDQPMILHQQIPIINRVAAGYPKHFTDLDYPSRIADDYLACPDVVDPQAFAARVIGDSMEPRYHEGDIVVFSPDQPTPEGSDCFVRLERDAETTFKRIFFEGSDQSQIRLQPLNNSYDPQVVDRKEVAGIYAAVYVMRRV